MSTDLVLLYGCLNWLFSFSVEFFANLIKQTSLEDIVKMDNNGSLSQQSSFSGRMVSFSFKIEKSQLLSPKQTDYVIVNQDGSHCGGSFKFNGVVDSSRQPTQVSSSASFPSVKCELAPEYATAITGGSPLIKDEPGQFLNNEPLNDSGFADMGLEPQQEQQPGSQMLVPKTEPGLNQ